MSDSLKQFDPSDADIARQELNKRSLLQRWNDMEHDLGGIGITAITLNHSEDRVRLTMTMKQFEKMLGYLEYLSGTLKAQHQIDQQGKLF